MQQSVSGVSPGHFAWHFFRLEDKGEHRPRETQDSGHKTKTYGMSTLRNCQGRTNSLNARAECSFSKGRVQRPLNAGRSRLLRDTSRGQVGSRSRLQGNTFATRAQSSKAEYEGDLSSTLLFQLSDSELENLASEYEYDIQSNKRKAKDSSPDYEDEEAEVDVHYEVSPRAVLPTLCLALARDFAPEGELQRFTETSLLNQVRCLLFFSSVSLFSQGISNEQAEEESRSFALSLAEALDEVKVQDITLLHVGPCVSMIRFVKPISIQTLSLSLSLSDFLRFPLVVYHRYLGVRTLWWPLSFPGRS